MIKVETVGFCRPQIDNFETRNEMIFLALLKICIFLSKMLIDAFICRIAFACVKLFAGC